MLRPKNVPPRGVLYARLVPGQPGYGRYWPAEDLAPFVEHYWTVSWDLREPEISEVLPHPSVHLVIEAGRSCLAGVPEGRFTCRLEGKGRVLGTKFRPGGFRPFLRGPVSRLTGRRLELAEVFGSAAEGLEALALAEGDPAVAFEVVQSFLRGLRPAHDPDVELVARIAERAATDKEIKRVEQLAEAFGLGLRNLQRLFSEYVGVSPRWIIKRYRLHEAVERIASGGEPEWAVLALDLGYSDQAHFIRDFRRLVGRTPADYARSARDTSRRREPRKVSAP